MCLYYNLLPTLYYIRVKYYKYVYNNILLMSKYTWKVVYLNRDNDNFNKQNCSYENVLLF